MDFKKENEELKKTINILTKETNTLKQIIDNISLETTSLKEINAAQKKLNGDLQTKLTEANIHIASLKDPLNKLRSEGDI